MAILTEQYFQLPGIQKPGYTPLRHPEFIIYRAAYSIPLDTVATQPWIFRAFTTYSCLEFHPSSTLKLFILINEL